MHPKRCHQISQKTHSRTDRPRLEIRQNETRRHLPAPIRRDRQTVSHRRDPNNRGGKEDLPRRQTIHPSLTHFQAILATHPLFRCDHSREPEIASAAYASFAALRHSELRSSGHSPLP